MESLVLSKLNYGAVLLSDATKDQLHRLQKVQNAAAGFVTKRHANIKDVIDLKWLPVIENIDLAIVKTAHCALHNPDWPSYLRLSKVQNQRGNLRSVNLGVNDIIA